MKQADDVIAKVDQALEQLETEMRASECHGALSGLFCGRGQLDKDEWLAFIAPGVDPQDLLLRESLAALGMLHDITRQQLNDNLLDFHPLLPEDDASIDDRIDSLAQWCQGFLLGLSAGGVTQVEALPGEGGEFLRDLLDIARADSYELEDDEQDEQSYFQLLEYVRTGVLLLNEEMHPSKAPPRSEATLH
jgi:uncharacterized protein YgfB (UPF0149 family)